ncbi:MAG: BON domain-containing protein, partial [Sphingobacteriales bacterium]
DGEVVLSGSVPDRNTKRRAADIADSTPGVTHIDNCIRVNSERDRS